MTSQPGETTFRLTLHATKRETQSYECGPDSRGRRPAANAAVHAQHADGAGYEIDDAKTGEEALNKLRDFHPDLVVLDMNMPGMGGLAAAAKSGHRRHRRSSC